MAEQDDQSVIAVTGGHGPACFWSVDLHVHTPASRDVQTTTYGASTPEEVVKAALDAGLDAIAVTDHNTADWCDRIAEAAAGLPLVVLPGIEISTTEGHLIGVWEEGTPADKLREVLTRLGIDRDNHGNLEITTKDGLAATAREVSASGGLAIAAHVDRPKGLLKLQVAAHVKKTLLDPALAAVEVVDLSTVQDITNKLGKTARPVACIRSSDVTLPSSSCHVLAGIGARRTWIKASRPDLRGLRYAFNDPALRLALDLPPDPQHMIIRSVTVTGGFLDGQIFVFSPDHNCLLGGTGTGKSLLIELIRFALNQQTNADEFPQIRREVDSRLECALNNNTTVEVVVQHGQLQLTVRRVFCGKQSPEPEIVGMAETFAPSSFPIRAFSQSEVIEYARAPVGRMALIDVGLDLANVAMTEAEVTEGLAVNATRIAALHTKISTIEQQLTGLPDTEERIAELAGLFDAEIVRQQEKWSKEKARFNRLGKIPELQAAPQVTFKAKFDHPVDNESNKDLYLRAATALTTLRQAVDQANLQLRRAFETAKVEVATVAQLWTDRFTAFDVRLAAEIAKIDNGGKALSALKTRLTDLQTLKTNLTDAARRLDEQLRPDLAEALEEREQLIAQLFGARTARRKLREQRIKKLNGLMNNAVRIKLAREADNDTFERELGGLLKGSSIRSAIIQQLCARSTPIHLIRSYLDRDPDQVSKATDVEVKHVERVFDWVAEKGLEEAFLSLQALDLPDALEVEFRKQGTNAYQHIEKLAHGEKCTAILIIALADGDAPLIIDQPEDALHAPWIEDHLVDRLRGLRGTRQYIFATRSPGLVVSADAEMLITMTSDGTNGTIEASGSLERYDLNQLALHHLEGGPGPFKRRSQKLEASL